MLKYKVNLIQMLGNMGYSTYRIQKEKIFNQSQLQQMRDNRLLSHDALNRLCSLLHCQPGDIMEWIPDDEAVAKDKEKDSI